VKKYTLFVLAALVVVTVLIAGCTSSSNPSPSPSPVISTASQNTVVIKDYAFHPSALTIQKGANVTWRNDDSVDHQITSDSKEFSSRDIGAGDAYTFQFNTTGTFPYRCNIHQQEQETIVVQ